jgi:hypothetical protein
MSEISRREIMTLAGAGLAISGCSLLNRNDSGNQADAAAANGTGPSLAAFAPCQNYGLPAATVPSPADGFAEPFNAPFIRIIHINFASPWTLSVNHASFPAGGNTDPARLKKVQDVFAERFDPTKNHTRFSQLTQHRPHQGRDWTDFDTFGFKSQHELFFFFESPLIRLQQNPLVVFSALPTTAGGDPIAENYSFVAAKIVEETEMGSALYARGRMFRMRNYVQGQGGTPITKERYSMNIHFDLPCGTNKWVPMVIDPDTGNGTGHEP